MSFAPKVSTMQQVCARLDDETVAELDRYVRDRSIEARVPLSRSLGVREILDAWATERREAREAAAAVVAQVKSARSRQHK